MECDIGLDKIKALQMCCTFFSIDWINILNILEQEHSDLQILIQINCVRKQNKFKQNLYINRYVIPHAVQEILCTLFKTNLARSDRISIQDRNKSHQHPSMENNVDVLATWNTTLEEFIGAFMNGHRTHTALQVLMNEVCALMLLQSEVTMSICKGLPQDTEIVASAIGKAIHLTERALEEFENMPEHLRLCLYCLPLTQPCEKILNYFPPAINPWLREVSEFHGRLMDRIATIAQNPIFQQVQISNILDIEKCGLWKDQSFPFNHKRKVRNRKDITSGQKGFEDSKISTGLPDNSEDNSSQPRTSMGSSSNYIVPDVSRSMCFRKYSSSTSNDFTDSSIAKSHKNVHTSEETPDHHTFKYVTKGCTTKAALDSTKLSIYFSETLFDTSRITNTLQSERHRLSDQTTGSSIKLTHLSSGASWKSHSFESELQ